MAKRVKKEAAVEIDTQTEAALATMVETHGDDPSYVIGGNPSFKARLAALETQLSEAQALVNRQALVIVQASENADELRKSREKVERLKAKAEEAKAASTSAKKAFDAAVEEHFDLEKSLSSGQQRLPFPPPESSDPKASGSTDETSTSTGSEKPGDGETLDDAWRSTPLDTLDLPKSITSKLYEANICTMGDLSDYQLPSPTGYQKRLTDIPGVGEASAEKILEAAAAFWSEWTREQGLAMATAMREAVEATEAERDGFSANGEWEESEAVEWEDSELMPQGEDDEDD